MFFKILPVFTAVFFSCFISHNASAVPSLKSLWCSSYLTSKEPPLIEPDVAKPLEDAAFAAMEQITMKGAESALEVQNWFSQIKNSQSAGRPVSVLEHITLVFALRSGFVENHPDANIKTEMLEVLAKSWHNFTGKEPSSDLLLGRLPQKVLRTVSHEVQQFHAAAFQNLPPRMASKELAFGKDHVWKVRDFLPLTVALAVGFHSTGRDALAGLAMGLGMGSVAEYMIHRYISHATPRLLKFYKKLGWVGQKFIDGQFSHTEIHHKKTFKVYDKQFANADEKKKLDEFLNLPENRGRVGKGSDYGLSLGIDGVIGGMALTLPFTSALTALVDIGATNVGLHPTGVFDTVAISSSVAYVLFSRYVHPYLHPPKDGPESLETNPSYKEPGPIMRWFLDTRYAAMISRFHHGHHVGRGGNYNLEFGADLVFEQLRKPTVKQLLEMKKLGLIF